MDEDARESQKTRRLPKVVFDSSFLIAVMERPTTWYEDITEELGKFEPIMLDCVAAELETLSRRDTKRARYANLARQLGGTFKLERCAGSRTDEEIVSYAKGEHAVVATVDEELSKAVRGVKERVITLRSGRLFAP